MKKYIILIICLHPIIGFSQSESRQNEILNNPKQIAFVNNVRIDSIKALYAQLNISDDYIVTASLSYGQNKSLTSNKIRNVDGDLFSFDSIAALLNLLDFNGWMPVSGIQFFGKSQIIIILKRK